MSNKSYTELAIELLQKEADNLESEITKQEQTARRTEPAMKIIMRSPDEPFYVSPEMCDENGEAIVWLHKGEAVIPAPSICPQVVAGEQGVEQEKGKEEQP